MNPVTVWAIYRSPEGAPAPFLVQRWEAEPGRTAVSHPHVFAASLEHAREVVPPGLERHDRFTAQGESERLIETWEAKK